MGQKNNNGGKPDNKKIAKVSQCWKVEAIAYYKNKADSKKQTIEK